MASRGAVTSHQKSTRMDGGAVQIGEPTSSCAQLPLASHGAGAQAASPEPLRMELISWPGARIRGGASLVRETRSTLSAWAVESLGKAQKHPLCAGHVKASDIPATSTRRSPLGRSATSVADSEI